MKIKILFSLIATSLLVGCGGSSSSNEQNANTPNEEADSKSTELTAVDNKIIVPTDGKEYTYKEHKLKCLDDGKVSYDSSITSKTINMNGLIFECKNSDTDDSVNKNYTLAVTATTATNPSGSECKNADGEFTIKDHKMTGTARDGWGRDYEIKGDEVDGKVSGGFAYAGTNAATYTGTISVNDVSGSWEDVGGCKGTWVGTAK